MQSKNHKYNLRGKDFRRRSFENKDFRNADIRGTDFSYSNLSYANFSQAKAGLPKYWEFTLLIFSFTLVFFAGLISSFGGAAIGHLVTIESSNLSIFGFFATIILTIYIWIVLSRGLGSIRALTEIIAVSLVITTILITVIAFTSENERSLNIAIGAEFTIIGLVGIFSGIVDMALGTAIAKSLKPSSPKIMIGVIAILGAFLGAIFGVRDEDAFFIAVIIAIAITFFGNYIGYQAIDGNSKYQIIHWLSLSISMSKSTKFIGANLTYANFTRADLNYTDFKNANLNKTLWLQAKGLEFSRREITSFHEIVELSVGDSINPKSAAVALQKLSKKYADKFQLLAIEVVEQNTLKIHTKLSEFDDCLKISNELSEIYRQNQLQTDLSNIPTEKDQYIDILENLLTTAIKRPNYYFNVEGELSMNKKQGNVSISETSGDISGIVAAEKQTMTGVSIGVISETVTNTINNLSGYPQSGQQKLKDLLTRLKICIETEEDLSTEDKAEALEQIKILAEVGFNPKDNALKKSAKTAVKILKGTYIGLSETTKLVKEFNQLLPAIMTLLSIA